MTYAIASDVLTKAVEIPKMQAVTMLEKPRLRRSEQRLMWRGGQGHLKGQDQDLLLATAIAVGLAQ